MSNSDWTQSVPYIQIILPSSVPSAMRDTILQPKKNTTSIIQVATKPRRTSSSSEIPNLLLPTPRPRFQVFGKTTSNSGLQRYQLCSGRISTIRGGATHTRTSIGLRQGKGNIHNANTQQYQEELTPTDYSILQSTLKTRLVVGNSTEAVKPRNSRAS